VIEISKIFLEMVIFITIEDGLLITTGVGILRRELGGPTRKHHLKIFLWRGKKIQRRRMSSSDSDTHVPVADAPEFE
jgi:hypothetical protein